jgi:hypothetical protein
LTNPYQRAIHRRSCLCSFLRVLSVSCFLTVACFAPSSIPSRNQSHCPSLYTRYAIMILKGYRISLSHLFFYISSFIIATQLWSIWHQSSSSYSSWSPSDWVFETDVHANVHTLAHEQCDSAFPELYYSLDKAVSRRGGRKVHIQDIEIAEGRCMLRVMIYQGEVCLSQQICIFSRILTSDSYSWSTPESLKNAT